MKTLPHRLIIFVGVMLFPLVSAFSITGQTSANQSSTSTATPSQSTSEGIQKRDNEWGVWGGIAFDSPTLIGKTPGAHYGDIGLRYGRVLAASKTVAFEWTIDVVPVAVLSNERLFVISTTPFVVASRRKAVYGAGAAPIGLKLNFRRNRRVQPFGQATGGFLYFADQVPAANTSQFNFTFDFSGGIQIVNRNRRSFTVGYKYHHISNGNTGAFNPGVDVQMVFAGFSVFR
jgi:Lipid A 3-O-deacylase (PagL)